MTSWNEKTYNVIHLPYSKVRNHGIPEHWLAGLVSVECARLDPKAHRFEEAVYNAIRKARAGQTSPNFPGFNNPTSKLGMYIDNPQTTDSDLRALATSYGLGQIMGYHYYNKWGLLPSKFANLTAAESVEYTLRMMGEGLAYATSAEPRNAYRALMRWWNTGSARKPNNGVERTHNPDYLDNAKKAADSYKAYLAERD